ncbi:hypothetical protein [Oceanicoccus sp. KOV_DT_Chl]|uniref:hypothetical protein n=1 Tax=Oceanicoccus sp. KOV_DT_Chl TaxID=1904639 RepID=UPI000C7CBEBA|nr:hypothetical protein [Oceanicoccus sp. KOV_DT_Chl]
MQNTKLIFCCLCALLLSACAGTSKQPDQAAANTLFCDNYFAYQMCAKDLDQNGDVDVMYFKDTRQIFMTKPDQQHLIPIGFIKHPCIQVMDEELQQASNKMLQINEQTTALQRTKIKTMMILNSGRYIIKINSCKDPDYAAHGNDNDSFGDEDFEDL